jgi:hypothetical protein
MRRRRSSIGALSLLLAASPVWGQEPAAPAEGGATFLLLPVGARAAALGQAAIADAGDSESAFWNPAGLALIRQAELAIQFASTFASNNTAIAAYLPTNRLGVLGIAGYLVDFGSQEVVPGPGAPTGRISLKNIELLASYATELPAHFTLGFNYKLIQFRQDCSGDCGTTRTVVGTTHGVDIGLQYAVGGSDNLRLGLAVRHLGFKLQLENRDQADPLPTRVQFGVVYRLFLAPPTPDAPERLDARFLLDVQNAWGRYNDPDARVGVELGYAEFVRLRAGYAFLHSESRGPSVGVGLRFGQISFDIARIFFDSSNFDEPVHISLRARL